MSPWIEAIAVKYGAVLLGVGAGTAAKYGLSRGEGRRIGWAEVISDLLLLPMIILLAAFVSQKAGADSLMQAVIAAFMAVSADRLLRMLRKRFLDRVEAEIRAQAERQRGLIREEVQVERSGVEVIADTIGGRAPDTYKALERHPKVHTKG